MGLPLEQVAQAAFFESWFQMHINRQNNGYYYKDVLAVLDQQYAILLLDKERELLKKSITEKNLIYLDPLQLLGDQASAHCALLFKDWVNDSSIAIQQILSSTLSQKELATT